MATQPKFRGRLLPRNDWEGDDVTPGAGGKYVTCVDTAAGRMVAYATNGHTDLDGKIYRRNIVPPDPNGITLDQVTVAVSRLTGLTVVQPKWTVKQAIAHLVAGRGLIVIGPYSDLPRDQRYQDAADFNHGMFAAYRGKPGIRVWDPLNPDLHHWGRWMPLPIFRSFLAAGHVTVAYIALRPL